MRRIAAVVAAAVTNISALGRTEVETARWHDEIDHMNPLASDARYVGQAARFEPPWSEAICVVTDSSGTWGVGMTALSGLTVPLINDYLAPMLIGDDSTEVERLWEMMTTACGAHFGAAGVASYAISAVDLALWDLRGKQQQRPVYDLVSGGQTLAPVPCYATGLDVHAYNAHGFEGYKLACPWGADTDQALERTVDVVESARSIVGAEAPLMLDCWGVHSPDEAILIGTAVEPYDLGWVEDYIFPEDWPAYAQVREGLPGTRLAAGERWFTDRPFAQAIHNDWVDVVQPDALWLGGATPTIRVAEMAAAAGVGLSIHCGGNDSFGQHLSYGLPKSLWAEFYIGAAPRASLADSYRSTPGMAEPIEGHLTASDAPGFGIELTLDDIDAATS